MPLRLYNTLTRTIEPFTPADPARVTFYTCGLTVYDDGHIGNFRSFLAADLLRRWIQSPLCSLTNPDASLHQGPRQVLHVMNITDVGHMTDDQAADGQGQDKMAIAGQRIIEATKSGKLPHGADVDPADPYAIARFFTERFIQDASRLGLNVAIEAQRDPSLMPRATDNIHGMIAFIAALIDRQHAYITGTPGSRAVYFDVQSFPSYGQLSGNTLDNLRGGAGGRVLEQNQADKKHPADFLLWKEDPTHVMKWPSPWGQGYPGWHIECSVMALARLIPGGLDQALAAPAGTIEIDLHSGGEDNIFPHHECERAQSCAIIGGQRFSRFWFHPRFLLVEGEKMSKSKGNFFTARDLFAQGIEPAALRLELIKTHYRTNANFSMQGLRDADRIVERWRRFRDQARTNAPDSPANATARDHARQSFTAALDNDLNTPEAIAAINQWVSATAAPSQPDADLMDSFDAVLAVLDRPRLERQSAGNIIFMPGAATDDAVVALIHDRAAAKKARDFARADAIRTDLLARGYAIKDVAGGAVEVARAD